MQFGCPACAATISANFAKPGRFTPKCPKCGELFVVQIQVTLATALASIGGPKRSAPTKAPAPRPPAPVDVDSTLPSAVEAAYTDTPSEGTSIAKGDPDATFASGTDEPVEKDFDRTAALSAEAATDPDSTFAGQPSAEAEDPNSTFASQPAPDGDDDATEIDRTVDHSATPLLKKPAAPKKSTARAAADPDMPAELGGYEILKQLGKGGMGAVYLARQMSLDRAVALKVMNEQWANDPVFIARFVREAYAAAQLTHHNVVQIYDIGQDANINYFSMEFVEGKSLGDVLKKTGKVPTQEAVGYILQAARGLKFAHDRGMVHRDIKPDNLMLNVEGIVKVADLGLVKTRGMSAAADAPPAVGEMSKPGSMLKEMPNVTNVGTAMGSPSYMAPEQCRDASSVDQRADVYSLGCSLYAMLSGRAPFTGATAVEVITKHLNEPPPPLQKVLPNAPRELAAIVEKTLKKDPADRYQDMGELIEAIKTWQAEGINGPPRATEEQLAAFEYLLGRMKINRAAKLERIVGWFVPVAGFAAALVMIAFSPVIAGGVLIGTVAAMVSMFVSSGVFAGSYVFAKVREWVFGARIVDWVGIGTGGMAFLAILYFAGLLWAGLLAIIVGIVLGIGYGFFFAKPARDHRLDLKEEFEKILKRLRLQGMDEDSVRSFVVETAGDRWEEAYELLYGYPAKIAGRSTYAEKVAARPKHGAWRDSIISKFDGLLEARKQNRARKLLKKMEVARLKAEGVSAGEANARAADAAEAIVEQAVEIKAANADAKKQVNVRKMMTAYERGKLNQPQRKRKNPLAGLVKLIFDPRIRLVAGAALLIVGLMWFKSGARFDSGPATPSDVKATAAATQAATKSVVEMIVMPEKYKPLAWLPSELGDFFVGVNAAIAGLLLIVSGFSGRALSILGLVLAAAIALVGHQLGLPIPTVDSIPDSEPLQPPHLTAAAGLVLGLATVVLLGRREE